MCEMFFDDAGGFERFLWDGVGVYETRDANESGAVIGDSKIDVKQGDISDMGELSSAFMAMGTDVEEAGLAVVLQKILLGSGMGMDSQKRNLLHDYEAEYTEWLKLKAHEPEPTVSNGIKQSDIVRHMMELCDENDTVAMNRLQEMLVYFVARGK